MADERRIIGYDVDGYDVITSAVMDLLNNYPGLEENDEIRFSVLDLSSGKAMFPSAGAVITMERISITDHVVQECQYPFSVVNRAAVTDEEISSALSSLHAQEKQVKKGQALLQAGDVTEKLGLVLAGSVTVESNDAWGNRTILSQVGKGQLFAETYALLDDEPLLVDVIANEDCRILFLRPGSLQGLVGMASPWVSKFTANLLTISSLKNLHLSGRSFHTAPKTVRGRVMAYLNTVSLQTQRTEFDIPFDRQQLADYLNVERTALSKELGKMQADGLIRTKKNHFVIC